MSGTSLEPISYIWVSPDGDDASGDGSEQSPLASIQAAADRAEPGTAVMVRAGSYYENVEITTSGTDDAPIWFVSADGRGEAHIIPTDQYRGTIVGRGTDNLIIRDFMIDGADQRSGIEFTQAGHDFTNIVQNITIEGNIIHDAGLDGIKIAQTENIDVVGNLIIGGREEGIDFTTVWNANVAQNEVRDLPGRGGIVVKGGSNNITIEENFVHDIAADGIIVGGWTDANLFHFFQGFEAKNITVTDNVVQDVGRRPINILAGQDSVIANNVLDPQNDYYTVINLEGDNNGLVTRNITIEDNLITRDNWLHVTPGHGEGLSVQNNTVGPFQDQEAGLDAYEPTPLPWSDDTETGRGTVSETGEIDEIDETTESDESFEVISAWQPQQAFATLGDAIVTEHDDRSKLEDGSIAFSFNTNDPNKAQGIVSKDAAYFGTGGHVSAWIEGGKVVVRLQNTEGSHTVETDAYAVKAGVDHDVIFSFGKDGMSLSFDGRVVDTNGFSGGIEGNEEPWVIGASAIYSSDLGADKLTQPFDGQIHDVVVFKMVEPEPESVPLAEASEPIAEAEAPPPADEPADDDAAVADDDTVVNDHDSVDVPASDYETSGLVSAWQLQQAFATLGDAVVMEHEDTSKIEDGSIAFSFNTNDPNKAQGIVSKDAAYFGTGGHISAWIEGGKVVVRLQDTGGSHTVETAADAVKAGVDHDVVVSFGKDGMSLSFDGHVVDTNDFRGGIEGNEEPWVIGASAIYSSDLSADNLTQPFDGQIHEIVVSKKIEPVSQPVAEPEAPPVADEVADDDELAAHVEDTTDVSASDFETSGLISAWQLQQAFETLGDAVVMEHEDSSKIEDGSIAFSFNTNDPNKAQGIVSKDAAYFGTGGHVSAWIEGGKVVVRLQDTGGSHTVETEANAVKAGTDHEVIVSFGKDGMSLSFDGQVVDTNDFQGGIEGNEEPWVIGASAIYSSDLSADKLTQAFDGEIHQIAVFDERMVDHEQAFDIASEWASYERQEEDLAAANEF